MSFVRRVLTSLGGACLAVAVLVALGLGASARVTAIAKVRASAPCMQARGPLASDAVILACESAEDGDHEDLALDAFVEVSEAWELGSSVAASDHGTSDGHAPRHLAARVSGARGPPA